jgi:polyisoprenoid-binding protein YceI
VAPRKAATIAPQGRAADVNGVLARSLAVFLLLAAGLDGAVARAAAPPAVLVASASEIGFVSRQMGVPVAGTFGSFDAQVQFDPTQPEQGGFVIGVDLASVSLPTADAMREVVKPEWFDAQRFPRAVFESTSIRARERGSYEIGGRLTIKGHAMDVVVPVRLEQAGAMSTASGAIVVRRLAFSIGEGDWTDTSVVADEVQIRFRLVLTGIPPL